MSKRIALSPDTILRFGPETRYTIKGEVGRGGSCIVYDAVYQTNAGDEKTVRIRECYPFDLQLERDAQDSLRCPAGDEERFESAKAQIFADFRLCNSLFYDEASSDSIINTINIHEANNTVYIVSAWSRENVLTALEIGSLRDCVSVVRQTAAAIRSIHQAGYLYLDIKPGNISVITGTSKRVQLFDFDSLIPLSSLQNGISGLLSYTRGFAAMELRRGQFGRMGFHTDVFGIGALLFYLLFGRIPEAPDCENGAAFDFSKMKYADPFPDRMLFLLEHFFRKTLAAFPPDRWQRMDEVVSALEKIERLADSVYPYLISSPVNAPAFFIGRTAETEMLEAWKEDDSRQNLFVTGMGGIGKSTFIRSFLAKHHGEWDSVIFLYYQKSLLRTITDDAALRVSGTERFPEEKEADYFERKLKKIREILTRDRVLLVIDNFEDRHDPDLGLILGLDCRKIFITREAMGSLNLPVLQLDAIGNEEELLRLFIHYLGREVSPEETDAIQMIIWQLGGHTLAVELFARQISNSFLTLPEASELLRKQGLLHTGSGPVDYLRDDCIRYEHLAAIITRLFEINDLPAEYVSIIKAAALFPAPGIDGRELFRRLNGMDSPEIILNLVGYGWIVRDHERIFLHPLIRDVVRDLPGTETTLAGVWNVLQTLCKEILSESHKEEINKKTLCGIDPETDLREFITDHDILDHSVSIARGVIDAMENDSQITGSPLAQKLVRAVVVNLPKHEDEAILHYGIALLDHPDHLTPLEILETAEPVEKALLARQEYDAAFRLMERVEPYAADERTKAEFCGLVSNIYDYRDAPGYQEEMLAWLEAGIDHARRAAPPERKHLLAEYLLSKLNVFTRNGIEDENGIEGLIRELTEIIGQDCLPYSEIRCGFATAMGFYWAELGKDRKEVDQWVDAANRIGKKLYPAGLDFIENCIIPPAIMYLDMKDFDASEAALREGIRICDSHPDLIAYTRKKHDLHRCLLDVYLEKGDHAKSRELLILYDTECVQYCLPDTINLTVRDFLLQR